ncbi:DEAD/DEAH box helicase [Marinobacter sp. bablab_jr008]|uniref:DEAD/DEAH box helicase n=1 Tax=Marinobacter sp. bablab_jr008 TaxID=2755064 RepID=UPI0018F14F46|nr:DEAD/DEAH box helicase [Marinobacter sp. bablab_jr008]MEC9386071.1 DEAD/DEAH box helicase [Pseudomonadota bacterium]
MGLFDLLRSMVSGEKENVSQQAGFELRADSSGVLFFIEPTKFDELKHGQGPAFQKMQLIALRMLEEQGYAEPMANGFHIGAENIAGLDDEQADVLSLPPRFPGSFHAEINGRSGNSGFRVNVTALIDGQSTPFSRKGPFLNLTSTETYRLTSPELFALEAWEHHQYLPPDDRGEGANLRLMAELQTAQRNGMNLDLGHFQKLDVVVPEGIGVVATKMPDGSLFLSPSLGDGSTPEELGKRWDQLDFDKDTGGALRIGKRVVLLEPEKVAAVKEVFGNRRIPADKVQEFIETPGAFLDASLVNLELGFSVRVEGVGKLQHMEFGEADAKKQDWFALDKLPAPPESLPNVIQSEEELAQFQEAVDAAWGQGADILSFNGETIDISDRNAVGSQLEQITENLRNPSGIDEPQINDTPIKEEKLSLVLKEAEELHQELRQKGRESQGEAEPDWGMYARQPFPHQKEGISWMLSLIEQARSENSGDLYRLQGALLADDMGLGKTYMSLVAVGEYLRRQKEASKQQKPILVVAPLSLLENWEDEVRVTYNGIPFKDIVVLQSGRDLAKYRVRGEKREAAQIAAILDNDQVLDEDAIRYALHIGPDAGTKRLDQERRLVLATYQTLRDYQFSLCRIDWGLVIFDEAQNIKNPNTLQTRAAKGLKADFKLLATGTPVENSLGDFWCLMDTAQPGLLGSWTTFRDTWIKPILEADEENRDSVRVALGKDLRDVVGPFMLRRVKEDQLSGLPAKTIRCGVPQSDHGNVVYSQELTSTMEGFQRRAYEDVLREYRAQQATEDMRGKALSVLQQLREISLHPRLRHEAELVTNDARSAKKVMQESSKLAVLLTSLDAIRTRGEKVILFMVTKRLQRLLKLWLDQIYGLDIAVINGDTAAVSKKSDVLSRKQLITQFEAKEGFNILIMSPVAAGVGLTVVGANHVIHLERHWNPAKEAQASDRVYRIGQTKPVSIHLPAVLHPEYDAFDVHLDRLLRGKLMLKDAVVTPEAVSENEVLKSMGL